MEKLLIKRIELDYNESDSMIIGLNEIVKNAKDDLKKEYPNCTISYNETKNFYADGYLNIEFSIKEPKKGITGVENL